VNVMRTTRYGAFVCALLLGAVSGCGSDDGASAEELRQARKDAASAARQDERIKQLERRLRQRERDSGRNSGTGESQQGPPATAAPSTGASCGNNVSVGPNTSCPFALNVRAAYEQSGGASTIRAYSPVTGVTYTMSCTGGSPHVCRGGNDASVYFP
jgi:hypothetical protein